MLASTYKKLEERGQVPPLSDQFRVASLQDLKDDITADFNSLTDKVQGIAAKGANAIGNVLEGVGKVVDKYAPSLLAGMATAQFRGTQGSFLSYTYAIRLSFRYFTIAPDRHEEIGYPCHRYKTLSTLSGFVLCENAKVPLNTTLSEQQAVEEFLNGGVFLE